MSEVGISFLDIEEQPECIDIIHEVIDKCLEVENLKNKNMSVSVTLTDYINIRYLNKKFRNIDKETDVLSFPIFEKEELERIKNGEEVFFKKLLGDIVVCIDKVKEQAVEYDHSFKRELAYMIVHSFYHLLGYDHLEENEKEQMRKKEEELLNLLNIKRG